MRLVGRGGVEVSALVGGSTPIPCHPVFSLGVDYMRRAGPVSRAGSVCRDLGTSVKHI